MSFSRPDQDMIENPLREYARWSGGKDGGGKITSYNRSIKSNVEYELPFRFVVLDRFSSITGWSDEAQSGIFCRDFKSTKQEIVVKAKNLVIAKGKYEDIKDVVKAAGGKFTAVVYAAAKIPGTDEYQLISLQLKGAALSPWIEFQKGKDFHSCAVVVKGANQKKKGATVYYEPVFEVDELTDYDTQEAIRLDTILQGFFDARKKRPADDDAEVNSTSGDVVLEDIDENSLDLDEMFGPGVEEVAS